MNARILMAAVGNLDPLVKTNCGAVGPNDVFWNGHEASGVDGVVSV
jgi:hypothetical protein